MKKLFLLLPILISVFAFILSPADIYAADFHSDTEAVLYANENVTDAVAVIVGDNCIAGIRIKGIILKSRMSDTLVRLSRDIKQNFPQISNVYITTSVNEIIFLKNARTRILNNTDVLNVYSEVLSRVDLNKNLYFT